MSKYIDADSYVEMQLYDDKHEEWSLWNGTVEDLLNQWTEEGCPTVIEVNEDCISREYVKGICEDMLDEEMLGHMLWYIEQAPSVTPPKRVVAQISVDAEELIERIKEEYKITDKVGEWVRRYCFQQWKCSECEYEIDGKTNYCPNCGAKMRG